MFWKKNFLEKSYSSQICSTIAVFCGSDFIHTVSIIENSHLDEIYQKKLG